MGAIEMSQSYERRMKSKSETLRRRAARYAKYAGMTS